MSRLDAVVEGGGRFDGALVKMLRRCDGRVSGMLLLSIGPALHV